MQAGRSSSTESRPPAMPDEVEPRTLSYIMGGGGAIQKGEGLGKRGCGAGFPQTLRYLVNENGQRKVWVCERKKFLGFWDRSHNTTIFVQVSLSDNACSPALRN